MTATMPKIPDPLVVLRRAEQRHTGEEPGDLDHLADAVRRQIITPLTAGGAPVADETQTDAELKKSVVELKRQLDEAKKDTARRVTAATGAIESAVAALKAKVEELNGKLAAQKTELDETRAERDTARAQLRDQAAADVDKTTATLRADLAERDARLTSIQNVHAAKVAGLEKELRAARRDLALANKTLDEIADEEAAHPAAPHRHQFELDLKTGEHADCDCGQPWIRDLVEDDEPVTPDVEPLTELLGRIRTEIAEAGWTA